MRPHLFDSRGGGAEGNGSNRKQLQESAGLAASSPRPYLATAAAAAGGGGGKRAKPWLIRSYRSREEAWARSRRRKVPTRILEDLLAAWRAGTEGLTPAEYGAAFVGHPEVMRGGGGRGGEEGEKEEEEGMHRKLSLPRKRSRQTGTQITWVESLADAGLRGCTRVR